MQSRLLSRAPTFSQWTTRDVALADSISRSMKDRQRGRRVIRAASNVDRFPPHAAIIVAALNRACRSNVRREIEVYEDFTRALRAVQNERARVYFVAHRVVSNVHFARGNCSPLRHSAESYHEQNSPGDNSARARNSPCIGIRLWYQVGGKRPTKADWRMRESQSAFA